MARKKGDGYIHASQWSDKAIRRYWSKVDRRGDNECWPWLASTDRYGYGQIGYQNQVRRCHQVAFELAGGTITEGMCVLHSCDNPTCVNSNHLSLGTHEQNMRDMAAKHRNGYGTMPGSSNPNAKLNEDLVREIRLHFEQAGATQTELARHYELSIHRINSIVRRRSWRHVE